MNETKFKLCLKESTFFPLQVLYDTEFLLSVITDS